MLSQLAGSLATRSQNCLTNEVPSGNIMTHFIGQALTNGDALRDVWLLTPPPRGGIIRAPRFLLKADLLDLICGGPLCESRPDIRAEIRERRLRVGFCRSLPFGLIRCTVQLCCSAVGGNRPRVCKKSE